MWLGIAIGVFALGAAGLEFWLNADRQLKRRMLKFPKAERIADAPRDKDMRLSGSLAYVDGSAPIIAPFSKRPCVAWKIVVERSENKKWNEIYESSAAIDFLIGDESARARVDSVFLTLALNADAKAQKHIIGRTTPGFVEFCGSVGIDTWGQSLRMREGVLEAGEAVTVCGRCRLERDLNAKVGYRGQSPIMRVAPLECGETLVSDDPDLV